MAVEAVVALVALVGVVALVVVEIVVVIVGRGCRGRFCTRCGIGGGGFGGVPKTTSSVLDRPRVQMLLPFCGFPAAKTSTAHPHRPRAYIVFAHITISAPVHQYHLSLL